MRPGVELQAQRFNFDSCLRISIGRWRRKKLQVFVHFSNSAAPYATGDAEAGAAQARERAKSPAALGRQRLEK